jgi:hypothetical protein
MLVISFDTIIFRLFPNAILHFSIFLRDHAAMKPKPVQNSVHRIMTVEVVLLPDVMAVYSGPNTQSEQRNEEYRCAILTFHLIICLTLHAGYAKIGTASTTIKTATSQATCNGRLSPLTALFVPWLNHFKVD